MDISKVTNLGRKALPLKYCGAVIVAAGTASRMGGIDKVMAPLKGEPMLLHTVRTFQNCDAIREIVVVTRQDLLTTVMGLCKNMEKVKAVVSGVFQSEAGGHSGRRQTPHYPCGYRPYRPCGSYLWRCRARCAGEGYRENRRGWSCGGYPRPL